MRTVNFSENISPDEKGETVILAEAKRFQDGTELPKGKKLEVLSDEGDSLQVCAITPNNITIIFWVISSEIEER